MARNRLGPRWRRSRPVLPAAIELQGEVAVEHGQAVARLEGSLDLDLERAESPIASHTSRGARPVRRTLEPRARAVARRRALLATRRHRRGRTMWAISSGPSSCNSTPAPPIVSGTAPPPARRPAGRRPSPRGGVRRTPRARSGRRTRRLAGRPRRSSRRTPCRGAAPGARGPGADPPLDCTYGSNDTSPMRWSRTVRSPRAWTANASTSSS